MNKKIMLISLIVLLIVILASGGCYFIFSTTPAVRKICSQKYYKIIITEYRNDAGEIGGYIEVPDPKAGVMDAPEKIYDKDGTRVASFGFSGSSEGTLEEYNQKLQLLKKNFPHEKDITCLW